MCSWVKHQVKCSIRCWLGRSLWEFWWHVHTTIRLLWWTGLHANTSTMHVYPSKSNILAIAINACLSFHVLTHMYHVFLSRILYNSLYLLNTYFILKNCTHAAPHASQFSQWERGVCVYIQYLNESSVFCNLIPRLHLGRGHGLCTCILVCKLSICWTFPFPPNHYLVPTAIHYYYGKPTHNIYWWKHNLLQ